MAWRGRLRRRAAEARRLAALALWGLGVLSPLLARWSISGWTIPSGRDEGAFLVAGALRGGAAAPEEPKQRVNAKAAIAAVVVALIAGWNWWHSSGEAQVARARESPAAAGVASTEAGVAVVDARSDAPEALEGDGPLDAEAANQILEQGDLLARLARHYWDVHAGRDASKLHFGSVRGVAFNLAQRLGATPPDEGEVFAAFLEVDKKASNYLSMEELSDFCEHQIGRHLAGVSLGAQLPKAATQAAFHPRARAGVINLTISTLVGAQLQVSIDDGAHGADLKAEVAKIEGTPAHDQRLLCHGAQLEETLALHAMGLKDGDVVLLVRVPAPPRVVELRVVGEVPSEACYRVVCSKYSRTEMRKDGRPIYRGANQKYLYFQEQKGRWAISDDGEWSAFEDNSWGFCLSSGAHPGELVDVPWHVSDTTYRSYALCKNVSMKVVSP